MLTQYFFLEAGQLETNHRKPHHGHIVGEGHLLRTKDPFLNPANSDAYPRRELCAQNCPAHTRACKLDEAV